MFLNRLIVLLFTGLAVASQHQEHHAAKRTDAPASATPTSAIDYVKVSSQLQALLGGMTISALVPSATVTLGISIPANLRNEIMTAVPPDILVKLIQPSYRESVASDFAAGNTPSWYQQLDPELKTFFEGMAKDIKTGSAVYTVTSTPTATPDATGDTVASTSSSGLAAAPTAIGRDMAVSIIALAGAAGVALML